MNKLLRYAIVISFAWTIWEAMNLRVNAVLIGVALTAILGVVSAVREEAADA